MKKNYELEVQHKQLPQCVIVIELDGEVIQTVIGLERLADDIEDLWYEEHPAYILEWTRVRDKRTRRAPRHNVERPESSASKENQKVGVEPAGSKLFSASDYWPFKRLSPTSLVIRLRGDKSQLNIRRSGAACQSPADIPVSSLFAPEASESPRGIPERELREVSLQLRRFRYALIDGDPKSGKTSLAIQLASANPELWQAFYLNLGVPEEKEATSRALEVVDNLKLELGKPLFMLDDIHRNIAIAENVVRRWLRIADKPYLLLIGQDISATLRPLLPLP
jgi:hypothetical protein